MQPTATSKVLNSSAPITSESSRIVWKTVPYSVEAKHLHHPAVGLIALSNDLVIEQEVHAFMPDIDYGLFVNRIQMDDDTRIDTLEAMGPRITDAASLILPGEKVDVICYGCTAGSMVLGPTRVASAIQQARPGVMAIDPISSGIEGLKRLGCERIGLVTPYPADVNGQVERFIKGSGLKIVAAATFGIASGYEMAKVDPACLLDAVREVDSKEVQGVFVSCTALRVSPIHAELERAIGKPVVSSNLALAWNSCRLAGANWKSAGPRLYQAH